MPAEGTEVRQPIFENRWTICENDAMIRKYTAKSAVMNVFLKMRLL